jgi:hypothetical protein
MLPESLAMMGKDRRELWWKKYTVKRPKQPKCDRTELWDLIKELRSSMAQQQQRTLSI